MAAAPPVQPPGGVLCVRGGLAPRLSQGGLTLVILTAIHAVFTRADGRGPLHWAARHGRTAVLRYLLTLPGFGVDSNQRK